MQPLTAPIRIVDWQGQVSNRGKFPAKPGQAVVQTNLRIVKPGELSLRKNATDVPVTVAVGEASPTGDCMSLFPYSHNCVDMLIAQEAGGDVYAVVIDN